MATISKEVEWKGGGVSQLDIAEDMIHINLEDLYIHSL